TYFEINARTITEDLVKLAGSLKNFQFILSPQTSNPNSLRLVSSRRDTPELYVEKVNLIRRLVPEANITAAIILGLPGDNLTEFKKTIDFCLSLEPSKLNVGYPLYLLPGSRFYEERDSMGIRYTTKPICAVLETPDFPQKDMNEAVRLICWVQLFTCYFPAIRNFLYLVSRKDKKLTPVARIEKWMYAIENKLHLLPEDIDFVDTVAASVKKWNEVKRDFFLKGSETSGANTIYSTIYELEKDSHVNDMENTIALGVKVFKYLHDGKIDSFSFNAFENLALEIKVKHNEIRSVFSTFKK
ncbi:MAG: radical SAM protein, partial [Dehalococcoidales bacterium]|nr:radical SAM protein [Dehalococcoidales bacterium]